MYRLILAKVANNPQPNDPNIIADTKGVKWTEIQSHQFDADAGPFEAIRSQLDEFIESNGGVTVTT